jgi:glycosyltransferase involved in cell wall biosynthesis
LYQFFRRNRAGSVSISGIADRPGNQCMQIDASHYDTGTSRQPKHPVGDPLLDVKAFAAPALGFLLLGGALTGAQVSHIRLANELARRGYPVHVWWAMDRPVRSPLDPGISEHWLFNATRYGGLLKLRCIDDLIGRCVSRMTGDLIRNALMQRLPSFYHRQLRELIRFVCSGVALDRRLIRRFAVELQQSKVTHVLPTIECLAPFVAEARSLVPYKLRFLLTYQSYEVLSTYARQIGQEAAFYKRLAEMTEQSDWPAIAVSAAYRARIVAEVGVPVENLATIPPGIPTGAMIDTLRAAELVQNAFSDYRANVPLVSFVGRRDSEKGLDLLLYAARILRARGIDLQLAICGPTAFGRDYIQACRQIAWNLRVPVLWGDYVSDELRSALFRVSHTVVYPSIHEEAFGMVPVEAMVQETPVIVPDTGGVAGLIRVGNRQAGLHFRSWDSGDLALQLERMLTDAELRTRLAVNTRAVAEYFSVERHGERILDHLGLPRWHADRQSRNSSNVQGDLPSMRRAAA